MSLRSFVEKETFTSIHVVVNTSRVEKKYGRRVELLVVAKGTGRYIRAAETELCDQDVKSFW
jgi:hypothetical protein